MTKRYLFFSLVLAFILPLSGCSLAIQPMESSSSKPASSQVSGGESSCASSENSSPGIASSGISPSSVSSEQQEGQTVRLTIPEGFTLSQIGDRLEAHGVCKKDDFIKTSQEYDFSYYPLVKAIPSDANRCYRLEGYLYPDTYDFIVGMKPEDAIGKMLRNTENKINGSYSHSGMTTDQLITLASVIEKEADNPEDMKKVASVFYNRLAAEMILQADATREYCNRYLVPLYGDRFNKYYNTYPDRAKGLPEGAICNPGKDSLTAAASPADTKYLYFATGTDHKFYYGVTEKERDSLMASAQVGVLYKD